MTPIFPSALNAMKNATPELLTSWARINQARGLNTKLSSKTNARINVPLSSAK